MVATLRSLSLLQVVKDLKKKEDGGYQIPDIPKELEMDIMIAKLFNGHYEKVARGRFSDKTTKVSVTYDGVDWTLSTNTLTTSFLLGIPHSMKLSKYKLGQNTTVGAKNPFFDIKTLLEMMQVAVKDGGQVPAEEDLVMRLKVQVNTENWRVGRLVFIGDTFKFVIRINRDWRGSRSLSHHGVVIVHGETKKKSMFITSHHLEETNKKIEIEADSVELVEKKEKGTVMEEEGKFENPEKFKTWQIMDDNAVKEFWALVEKNE